MRYLMILAAIPLAACGSIAMGGDSGDRAAASGAGSTRNFAVTDFNSVELAGADDVDVSVGPAFSVRAEGPSEELDRLEIRKTGSTLSIGRKRDGNFDWGGRDRKAVKVFVTMPAIAAAALAGSGDMRIDKVAGGDFTGALAGSGDLSVAEITADSAKLEIAGSGGIAAKGAVRKLSMAIAGAGDIDARGLTATGADVSIAGSGNASATVNGPASVSIMGSGDVSLGANAKCTTSKMGSGEVRCG